MRRAWNDEMILAGAVAATADYVVTHDDDLLRGSRGPLHPAAGSGVRAIRDISGSVTLEMPVKSPRVIAMCSQRSGHSTRDA